MCKNSNFTEFKIPTGHLFSKYKSHHNNLQFVFTRDKIMKKNECLLSSYLFHCLEIGSEKYKIRIHISGLILRLKNI